MLCSQCSLCVRRSVECVIIEIEVHSADGSGWRLAWNRSRRGGAFILNQKDGCTRQPPFFKSSSKDRCTGQTVSPPLGPGWPSPDRSGDKLDGKVQRAEAVSAHLKPSDPIYQIHMRLASGAWRGQRNIFPGMAKTKSNRCLTSVYWLRASTLLTVAVGNISCKGPPLNR